MDVKGVSYAKTPASPRFYPRPGENTKRNSSEISPPVPREADKRGCEWDEFDLTKPRPPVAFPGYPATIASSATKAPTKSSTGTIKSAPAKMMLPRPFQADS